MATIVTPTPRDNLKRDIQTVLDANEQLVESKSKHKKKRAATLNKIGELHDSTKFLNAIERTAN